MAELLVVQLARNLLWATGPAGYQLPAWAGLGWLGFGWLGLGLAGFS